MSSRRQVLGSGAAACAFGLSGVQSARAAEAVADGKLRQSVCAWCFRGFTIEQLAEHAVRIGLKGIDLVRPADFPVLKKHGLVATMVLSHGLTKGLNHKENHAECLAQIRDAMKATSEAGFRNVICFSGNRAGIDDETGMKNCAEALKQIVGEAEKLKITLQMELLNSKVNHKDYQCDTSDWGVALVKMVGSENFKLLYDIYHMQIQEGNVIATIQKYKDYFAHYHTAGVPGRNELDETQELNYPAISRAIAATGFQGYFAHEFIPKRDPITSLTEAAKTCLV